MYLRNSYYLKRYNSRLAQVDVNIIRISKIGVKPLKYNYALISSIKEVIIFIEVNNRR